MKFIEAFAELVNGEKIGRKSSDGMFISTNTKMASFSGKEGFIFNTIDFLADDWQVEE